MPEIPSQRDLFSIPREIAYLNCGYMSPLAHRVLEAVEAGARLKTRPWDYTAADFFTIPEETRGLVANIFSCAADNVALVPSASYGLAIAATNLPLARGQEIVLLKDQFPANVYVWRDRAADAGARIIHVERDADASWTAAVLAAIGPDTAIVAVPHCHWADGGLVDLVRVGAACRAVGAALVLDVTQSLGAMPLDIAAVDPDFAVVACYKWMMSPYGTGALYVAPRHQRGRSIEQPWINRAGAEDFARLVDYRDNFQPGARRYDMGEKSNPPLLMGMSAAARLILGWGIETISATLGGYTRGIAAAAQAIGFEVLPEAARAPHFLSLGCPGGVPHDLPQRLAAQQVFVSVRGNSVRVTPHLYNDAEDAARLLAALEKEAQATSTLSV
jgi:selenocysteine lyase/cysteine desulfurase